MATVLLVEDNEIDQKVAVRALSGARGVRNVKLARDGAEALRMLFNEDPCPHLVFLDLKLPKNGGMEVLKKMKEDQRTKRCPVVVFSSSSIYSEIAGCYDLGANSFIRKPMDYDTYKVVLDKATEYWLRINEPWIWGEEV